MRKSECRCQTQLIDESGGRAAAEELSLVAEQERRLSAETRSPPRSTAAHLPGGFTAPPPPPPPPPPPLLPPLPRLSGKSDLMSGSVLNPWLCGRVSLVCGLLLLVSLPLLAAGRLSNCTHPLVPEHGGFRCDPSPCRGFPQKSSIHLFCEPGYHISNKVQVSRCRHGRWQPPIPACLPNKEGPNMNSGDRANDSMPNMATMAVGVSIFLLTTTACLVVKSRLYPCQSHSSRRSSDQVDLMVDGLPVSLPSYEEAVYGSWGQRLPPCATPGPTQLLLAQEAPPSESDASRRPLLSGHSPDNPPPPYEEVQSSRPRDGLSGGDVRHPHADKDT